MQSPTPDFTLRIQDKQLFKGDGTSILLALDAGSHPQSSRRSDRVRPAKKENESGFSGWPRERGVALVIVLAFVVLLSGLVVAFFSRAMAERQTSNSSLNEARADQLAYSALAILSSDLKQEIANSSTATTFGSTTIYTATSNINAVPVRNGVPATWSTTSTSNWTLLRISSTNSISFPAVDQLASSALSTGTSVNGRAISPSRWNQHYLIPLQNPGTPGNPIPDKNFTNAPPSWVYVTGTGGPVVLATPTNAVVGRYAYAIYDEGALLDVNAAGFPQDPATSGSMPAQYSHKGALAFADLTQLTVPGVSGSLITQAGVNNLVGWRNYASLQPSNTFPGLTFSGTTVSGTFTNSILSNTNGFLRTSGSNWNGNTDQVFLSRQQLINIAISTGSADFNLNALQYLGTFSRAVTGPSWSPQADASALKNEAPLPATTGSNAGTSGTGNVLEKSFAYKTNSETNGFVNRDLANLRFPNAGTITHYADDGTTTTYSVNAGDSFLQRRFSLARINWLTHTGPASGMTQAVQDCFGLTWGQDAYSSPCWIYKHGSHPGASGTNQILTLDAVAALGREPDFFEMLKAAILNGSLGRDPGKDYTNFNGGYGNWWYIGPIQGAGGTGFDKTSSLPDQQIIQIGVNIIDQYHSDSYPTAVYFQGPNVDDTTVPENGPLNVFYGIKNLPYLNRINTIYWDTSGANGQYNGFNAWMQPELWNPFQMLSVSATGARPTSFCAQVFGGVQLKFTGNEALLYGMPIPDWNYDSTYKTESYLYFKDPVTSGANVSTFANPLLLSASNQDTSVATTPAINVAPAPGNAESQSPYNVSYTQCTTTAGWNQFMGFHASYSPFTVVPFNGVPFSGAGTTGTVTDSRHTWVADNNEVLYPIITTTSTTYGIGNWGNFQFTLIPNLPPLHGVTFCLKYWDGSNWLPYTYMSRVVDGAFGYFVPTNTMSATDPVWCSGTPGNAPYMHVDPLTDRFAGFTLDGSHYHWIPQNNTWEWLGPPPVGSITDGTITGEYNAPQPCPGAFYYDFIDYQNACPSSNGVPTLVQYGWSNAYGGIGLFFGAWAQNIPMQGGNDAYYADPDGIVRPGNDCCWNVSNQNKWQTSMTDGLSQLPGGYATTGTGAVNTHTMGRRPLILNRAFRSVGEMGYAQRDLPFKSLDFFTAYSADAALLDLFSVTDQPPVIAGQINPNNAPAPVLQAILAGAAKQEALPSYYIDAESKSIASSIGTYSSAVPGGFSNRADLVTKLGVQFQQGKYVGGQFSQGGQILQSSTQSVILHGFASSANPNADQTDKTYLEAPVRALADVTNTRTWNLMIDVIAQTGSFTPNAKNLQSFAVQGERRYWLHIAIDRFTGMIIDEQLEPVYE